MEAQEIFDTVVRHLAQMPRRSMKMKENVPTCAYRGGGGLKCAVGALITDEEFVIPTKSRFAPWENLDDADNTGVVTLCDHGLLPERLRPHLCLLYALQRVHDEEGYWRKEDLGPNRALMGFVLGGVAVRYDLDDRVVKELFPGAS